MLVHPDPALDGKNVLGLKDVNLRAKGPIRPGNFHCRLGRLLGRVSGHAAG